MVNLRFRLASLFWATFFAAIFSIAYTCVQRSRSLSQLGIRVLKQASQGDFGQVGQYLDAGGNPDQKDQWGATIGFYSISFSENQALRMVIAKGGKLRYVSAGVEDNLLNAISAGDNEIIKLVLSTGEWDDVSLNELENYLFRAELRKDSTEATIREHFKKILQRSTKGETIPPG